MLNSIKMSVVKTAKKGIVDRETIFHFDQEANLVSAVYAGGRISKGYLVGQLHGKILRFTYCQRRVTGELDHGESECRLSVEKESGKIKLEEHFKMDTEGSHEVGINIFVEV